MHLCSICEQEFLFETLSRHRADTSRWKGVRKSDDGAEIKLLFWCHFGCFALACSIFQHLKKVYCRAHWVQWFRNSPFSFVKNRERINFRLENINILVIFCSPFQQTMDEIRCIESTATRIFHCYFPRAKEVTKQLGWQLLSGISF